MKSPGAIAFSIFGIDIRYYGILIAIGMAACMLISLRRTAHTDIAKDKLLDGSMIAIFAGIIGARLYYVMFSFEMYKDNIGEILHIRSGGLAIHGGLILGSLALFVYCKKKDVNFLEFADLVIPGVALAQSIGRWGNFFNEEAYGSHTDLPFALNINGETVHPTFLYESLWCLLIFIVLSYMFYKKHSFNGQLLFLYGMLYSAERFFVEGLRVDSLYFMKMRQAQLISILIFLICALLYYSMRKKCIKNN